MPRWCHCFANRIRRVSSDTSNTVSSSTMLPSPVDETCLCHHSWRGGSVPSPSYCHSRGLPYHHSAPLPSSQHTMPSPPSTAASRFKLCINKALYTAPVLSVSDLSYGGWDCGWRLREEIKRSKWCRDGGEGGREEGKGQGDLAYNAWVIKAMGPNALSMFRKYQEAQLYFAFKCFEGFRWVTENSKSYRYGCFVYINIEECIR